MITWYEQRGEGDPLVLLHPGMADARAFDPNIDALAARFHVYTAERRGHGRTRDTYRGLPDGELAVVPGNLPWPPRREARAVQCDGPRLPRERPCAADGADPPRMIVDVGSEPPR